MDDEGHPDGGFNAETTINNYGSAPYAGAFFPRSKHFTVLGSTFTSISNHYTSLAVAPDVRIIPRGDIDLRREIRLHEASGIVDRPDNRWGVRRIYSARIHGESSDMTVVLHQGESAEEKWRQDITKYSSLWHPNFLQIFAAARSPGFHAAIFHDDLMPCQDLLKLYRQSPLLTVYIHAYCDAEFDEAKDYFEKMCQQALDEDDCTFWIRRSTRRLCVDLTPSDIPKPEFYVPEILTPETILPFDDLNIDSWVIDLLQLQEYHSLCYWHLGRTREISVSPQAKWTPGAVIWCPSGSPLEPPVEVASLPYQDLDSRGWSTLDGVVGEITKNGWSRFCSSEIFNTTLDTSASLKYYHSARWLSQANRLFRRLKITSNYEDYVFIRMIVSQLEIPAPTQKAPQGYLLVYPHRDLRTGELTSRWPEYPAFWSFDGVTRLSTEQAAQFGFPSIKFSTQIHGEEWDSSVYAGLRKFHEGKGFDPEDEDLPWHLRGPLYRLSSETDVPFAHDEPEHRPPPMFHSKTTINDLGSLEMEMEVLFAHELSQYHHICYWDLGQCLNISYSEEAELNLAAVVYWPSGSKLEVSDEIALLTDVGAPLFYWVSDQAGRKNLENGWTRYNCRQMSETTIYTARAPKYHDFLSWLSQANYIFSRFRITSNYEAYVIIRKVNFNLAVSAPMQDPPEGYLFVCPPEDFRTGATSVRWPRCPAYWSLDPSGAKRLNTDEATLLGFPAIELTTNIQGYYWDARAYAGLRQFHRGKGFDPESQDIAKYCGHQLLQLLDVPFPHAHGEISDMEAENEMDYSVNPNHEQLENSTSAASVSHQLARLPGHDVRLGSTQKAVDDDDPRDADGRDPPVTGDGEDADESSPDEHVTAYEDLETPNFFENSFEIRTADSISGCVHPARTSGGAPVPQMVLQDLRNEPTKIRLLLLHVDGEVSDTEDHKEDGMAVTTSNEDVHGSPSVHAVEDGTSGEPFLDAVEFTSWKVVMTVKLVLILALAFASFCGICAGGCFVWSN